MNEENREPLSDSQLSALLKKWEVAAPPDLENRVMRARERRSWWRFLVKGYIRVPVPVACCVAVLIVALMWQSARVAVACVAENSAVPAVHAQAVPSAGYCPAGSKC